MRQFIRHGPELPYEILQAHEEERLVFFCGAGVSYYTGLPDFRKLVKLTFSATSATLADTPNEAKTPEDWAFHEGRLDQALHLLEQKVSRPVARRAALRILSAPPAKGSGTLRQHKALLDLSAIKGGGHRLVTTNFDDRFTLARRKAGPIAEAPRIGWPRANAWKHLTYLHGRISQGDDVGEDLILSSGDFGRAYMTEGWAARFVVELFREYTVVFVGYSLNDPVLRYIVDGLATDMREGRFHQPFVLAGFADQGKEDVIDGWKAKGVTAIPFPTGPDGSDYSLQFETLTRWAENHRGGLDSRIAVARDATSSQYIKTPDDQALKNVVWALSKSDASVAKAFAEVDPPPDVSWLAPISDHLIPSEPGTTDVSLLAYPSPPRGDEDTVGHHLAPLSGMNAACISELPIHPLTFQMGRWLRGHRESQDLVDWVIARHGIVHPSWALQLSDRLSEVSEPWRTFWSVVIKGDTLPPCGPHRDINVQRQFRRGRWPRGGSDALLDATRAWVTPEKPYRLDELEDPPETLEQIARFSLKLADVDLIIATLENQNEPEFRERFAFLADQATSRLISVLSLAARAQVSVAGQFNHIRIPSIADAPRDRRIESWEALVRLVRISFDCLNERDPAAASVLAARWREQFQGSGLHILGRLSVYALSRLDELPSGAATDFLLAAAGRVLWGFSAWPEVAQFIRTCMPTLTKKDQKRILTAIRTGPTRTTFPQHRGSDDEFADLADTLKARRAFKVIQSGVDAPVSIRKLVAVDEGEAVEHEERHHEITVRRVPPRDGAALLDLEPAAISTALRNERGWDAGHRLEDIISKDLSLGLDVVSRLAEYECEDDLWDIGLGALVLAGASHRSRKDILERVLELGTEHPEWLVPSVLRPVARALSAYADKISKRQEGLFLDVWDMAWSGATRTPEIDGEDIDAPVDEAINAPGGILAEGLLNLYFSKNPRAGSGFPQEFRQRFDGMDGGERKAHRLARVVLASRLLWLHRIDPEWTRSTIISKLTESNERLDLWAAYLWPSHWDVELAADIEAAFRRTLSDLGQCSEELASRLSEWFASVSMNAPDLYSRQTKQAFFQNATATALGTYAWVIENNLKNAKQRAAELWRLRVKPLVDNYWPADRAKISPQLSSRLLDVALACREAFPDAVDALAAKDLIIGGSANVLLWDMPDPSEEGEYDIVTHHAGAVLKALSLAVGGRFDGHLQGDLAGLLDRIHDAAPDVANDDRFVALRGLAARG